jgi:hypothetical protein
VTHQLSRLPLIKDDIRAAFQNYYGTVEAAAGRVVPNHRLRGLGSD